MSQVQMPVYLDLTSCPICRSASLVPWRVRCRDMSGAVQRRFSYRRCTGCRAAVLVDAPRPEDAAFFYPAEYEPYVRAPSGHAALFSEQPTGDTVSQGLQAAYRLPRPQGRFLDFGCGSPAILDFARDAGWVTTGADFSPGVVRAVRDAGHQAVLVSDLWPSDDQFDLIRANHVIEHLYDPVVEIGNLLRRLSPGGTLHLATPNPDGVSARLFRRSWFSLDPPRHTIFFPPDLLVGMVRDAGAAEVDVLHESSTKDFARSATYLRHNIRLGGGDVRGTDGSRLMNRVARPIAARAARGGWSDRYHVLARTPR